MRVKPRYREVFNKTTGKTEMSPYPPTREEALIEESAKFLPLDFVCPTCNEHSVHFTLTGISACCANRAAAAAYSQAIATGEPVSISDANAQGKNYYWHYKPGPYCGHVGKTTLAGKCAVCAEEKADSPRQVALRSGATWYQPVPGDLCMHGHNALRRVVSGSCKQCEDDAKAARHAHTPEKEQPIYRLVPDLVISRENAKALGYLFYRTGPTCSKDASHAGWRYVSTGACIECTGRSL